MPIYDKASTSDDIVNGAAVVMTGGRALIYDNTDRTQHLASGDSLTLFQTLDERYKVDPSGWSA